MYQKKINHEQTIKQTTIEGFQFEVCYPDA